LASNENGRGRVTLDPVWTDFRKRREKLVGHKGLY